MGAENQVTVQLQTLNDVVSKLGMFGSDITAHLDELEQRVARLHVQWSGASATAHRKAHEEWSEGARQMADGVQRMQRAAAAAHAAFADAARQNRSMFLMSSGELRVDSTEVAAVAQFADDIASRLVDRYLQTSEEVSALLDGKWKGSAAEACSQAWQEWSDGFRLVVAGLRDESAALQEAAAQYVSTDADGAARIAEV